MKEIKKDKEPYTINFEDFNFENLEEIEEVITPAQGSYFCCV